MVCYTVYHSKLLNSQLTPGVNSFGWLWDNIGYFLAFHFGPLMLSASLIILVFGVLLEVAATDIQTHFCRNISQLWRCSWTPS